MSTTRSLVKIGSWTAVGVLGAGMTTGVAYACNGSSSHGSSSGAAAKGTTASFVQGDPSKGHKGRQHGRPAAHPKATPLATASPSTSTATSAATMASYAGWAGAVEHGQLTIATPSGAQLIDVQSGTVTAVSATSLTVLSADGYGATYTLGSTSKIVGWKTVGPGSTTTLHAGDRVEVVATHSSGTADLVKDFGASAPKAGTSS